MKKFNQFREDSLLEVLKASDPTGKWISDFVHSDNPKFAGKSKKERIRMALGASYASKRNEEVDLNEAGIPKNHTIEAHGIRGMNGIAWRKTFKNHEHLSDWADKNDSVEVHATRDLEQAKKGNLSPAMREEASPMIKPPSNRFDNKKEAFTHAKTHGGKVFRSTYIDPNTGNKNITFVVKKGVAEANYQHTDGHAFNAFKAELETKHGKGNVKIDGDGNVADAYHVKTGKHLGFIDGSHAEVNEQGVAEAKDEGEYDYEGAMAKTQLQTICRAAAELKDILKDDENLPEWVQSKITKAEDYITSSLDYMKSSEELGEEVEELDELSKSTLASYAKSAAGSATIKRKIAADFENRGTRAKSPGMKQANAKLSQDYKEKSWKRQDNVNKAIDRLAKEEVEPIEELNKDTLYSYTNKADKDITKRHKELGAQIRADKSIEANKNAAKIGKRLTGTDRAETRLNKEDTEVAEARMSAAQRLWNAEQKQRAKSDASLARTPSSIPKPEEKK
jgi:hypothetical protein